jgi:hypothetical protein
VEIGELFIRQPAKGSWQCEQQRACSRLTNGLPCEHQPRAIVQRFLNAYPAELPNRTDINEHALNTNSNTED